MRIINVRVTVVFIFVRDLFYEVAARNANIRELVITIITSKDGPNVSVIMRNVIHELVA